MNLWKWRLVLVILILQYVGAKPSYKKQSGRLSADPIERAKYIPPPTWHSAITSSSTVYKVFLKPDAWESHLLIWQTALLVDSHERFVFTIISPLEKKLTMTLVNPNGEVINTDKILTEGTVPFGHTHFIANSYILNKPMTGAYRVMFNISAEMSNLLPPAGAPHAILICYNKSRYRLHSYFSEYNFVAGYRIGIIARMYQSANSTFVDDSLTVPPSPIAFSSDIVTSAILTVKYPSGKMKQFAMSDDASQLEDKIAKDKIYGAGLKLFEEGEYIAQVTVRGVTPEGADFTRSTQHVFPVIKNDIRVVAAARAYLERPNIRIDVDVSNADTKPYRIFTEMWLYDGNQTVPVCWISEYVNIKKTPKQSFFYTSITLDLQWIKTNGVIVLRNIYLQDIETNLVTAVVPQIILYETKEMLSNLEEKIFEPLVFLEEQGKAQMVFLPDQYAERNPFKINSDKFPKNSQFFRSSKICHTVHSYTEAIANYVEKSHKFSFVAHAFGGLAAVNLYNYYWTGLDNSTSDKLIQVINSPFKGNPAAGTLAMIGHAFQMDCKFSPLSTDMSNLWLIGISGSTRNKVVVYTSHHSMTPNDYCSLPMNSLLASPNDGVVEYSRAQLPGASKNENKERLCHTWNMKHSAQFGDITLIENLIEIKI